MSADRWTEGFSTPLPPSRKIAQYKSDWKRIVVWQG
jgi:hypothetical protein